MGSELKCKKLMSMEAAVNLIKPGSRVLIGGFGNAGDPKLLIEALWASGIGELVIMSNDLGSPNEGLGRLLTNGQVRGLIGTYYNWNPEVATAYNEGRIFVDLVPQGTFAEAVRAAGVGIPAFYTPTAVGTEIAKGKETREFNGKTYVLQEALKADVALIKAQKADELGNLVYYKTARNFNPVMAMAADLVIAEVDEVVPRGCLDPECVVTPHIFVDVIVNGGKLS
jgi:3-oxoacid CoA-transferase A subunit